MIMMKILYFKLVNYQLKLNNINKELIYYDNQLIEMQKIQKIYICQHLHYGKHKNLKKVVKLLMVYYNYLMQKKIKYKQFINLQEIWTATIELKE